MPQNVPKKKMSFLNHFWMFWTKRKKTFLNHFWTFWTNINKVYIVFDFKM